MLETSFDETGRAAAIAGAYQYDTGQRVRLHGLPSPDELAERDDFLSGDEVAVQAQFSWKGERTSMASTARWDEDEEVWVADVPDRYLRRAQAVYLHVYVMYGAAGESTRSKTMYEAVYTPISRSAPMGEFTQEQESQWDALMERVTTALMGVEAAIAGANGVKTQSDEVKGSADALLGEIGPAIQTANTNSAQASGAATNASSAASAANSAASGANAERLRWERLVVEASTLAPGSEASVTLSTVTEGGVQKKKLAFGIPRGRDGQAGEPGGSDIDLRFESGILYIECGE